MQNTNQKQEITMADAHGAATIVGALMIGVFWNEYGGTISYIYRTYFYLIWLVIIMSVGLIGMLAYDKWQRRNPEKWMRKVLLKICEKNYEKEGAIYIGNTLQDQRPIYLTPEQRTGHVQILGSTGRGKTKSVIVPWFARDLRQGLSPILIDGKGDYSIVSEILQWSNDTDRVIHVFNPEGGGCTINPLEGGNPHEVADRLFASLEFDSAYFREVQYSATLSALELMAAVGNVPTLKDLHEALSNPQQFLETLNKSTPLPSSSRNEFMKISQMRVNEREERFSGILSQLRPFTTGIFKGITNSNKTETTHVSIEEVVNPKQTEGNSNAALIVLLPTMQYQKTAKALGKLILQSIAWASAKRDAEKPIATLFIDEFSAFVYEGFEQFLNKARSKGVAVHLSHQSMGDLESVSPSFAKTVNVNTNTKVLLGLNDPDTADYFARHLGTFTTTKETERASKGMMGTNKSGEMSLREVEQYRIHPNRLKAFSHGRGVLSVMVAGVQLTEEVQFEANGGV